MGQGSALFGRVAMPRVDLFASMLEPPSAIRVSLLLIVLLGTALRFHQLESDSLWPDEIVGTMHAQSEVVSIPASLREAGAHPPLWHLLTHFVLYLGRGEFILRFPAALMGILSIPLTYVVGQRLFNNIVGLLGAFLLTISPFHIRYSQEARMYAAMLLFSLFSLYFLWRGLERGEKRAWLGFALSTLLNIYNTYFAFLVLIGEVVFVLVVVGARSWPGKARGVRGFFRSWFRAFSSLPQVRGLILSLIIVGLLYLPWLPVARENLLVRQRVKEGASAGPKKIVSLSLTLGLAGDFSPHDEGPFFLIFIGAFMVGLFVLALRSRWKEFLLVIFWLAPPFMVIALWGGVRKLPSRYLIHLLPIYVLLISVGVSGFGSWLRHLLERCAKRRIGVWGVEMMMGAAIIGALSIAPIEEYYSQVKQNWRDIAAFLTQRARSDEVIAVRHWLAEGLLYYSSDLANVHSVGASLPALERTIAPYNGTWFLLSSGKTADPKGEIKRWLAENEFVLIVRGRSGGGLSLYYGKNGGPMTMEETIGLLGEATEFFPEPRLHCNLGEAYEAMGEFEKAEMEYRKGLELDPANRCCLRGLERLTSAEE